jgi:hypothetical protein
MVYDARHALEHPEVAGWALGSLDPGDVPAFEQHLQTCEQCRGEVAEFTPVAESLALAAPAVEPPAGFELKVVAAVQYAAMAESAATVSAVPEPLAATTRADVKPGTPAKTRRWWHLHWTSPPACRPGRRRGDRGCLPRRHTVRVSTGTGRHLHPPPAARTSRLGHGQFYECVYLGHGGGELVSAGTFLTSNGPVTLRSAANPREFRIIQIRREQPGVDVQDAPVVLTGGADTHS